MSSHSDPPGLRRIIGRELRQIGARPALAFMLVPMPLLILLALAAVFAPGLPRNLPVAVVDLDGSTLSRQVVRMVDGAADVAVVAQLPSLPEARAALTARDVYAILLIPAHMERNLQSGQRPEIVIFSNNQFLAPGGIAARSMAASVRTFSGGVSLNLLQTRGIGPDRANDLITPVPVQQSPLFNPALDYIQFLLSAIIPTVMQIFICAAAVLSFSRDRHAPDGMARVLDLSGSPARAILGKLLPYTVLGTLVLLLGDILLFSFFGADFRGNVAIFFFNGLIFILACQALGGMLAMLAKDATSALGVMAVIVAPAFGFAGVSFPRIGMSDFAQVWGAIIPLTPYLELRTDQTLRGTPWDYSLPTFAWLATLLVLYGGALWMLVRRSAGRVPT